MWRSVDRKAVALLAASALSFGCATAMVPVPSGVGLRAGLQGLHASTALSQAIPKVNLGAAGGGTITMQLPRRVFGIKGLVAKSGSDLQSCAIELLNNQPGDNALNPEGVPNYGAGTGNGMNDYSAAAALASYTMPATDPNQRIQFVNVPPGTYRVRVKALDAQGGNITQPDPQTGPPGSDRIAISTNSATITLGAAAPTYNNAAPNSGSTVELSVNLQLQNGAGDQVDSFVTVSDGTAIPAIGSGDGTI